MSQKPDKLLGKLVHLKWIDSGMRSGWKLLDDIRQQPLLDITCHTVGYVMGRNKRWIKVAQSLAGQGGDIDQASNFIQIPLVAIEKLTLLKEPR